MKAPAYGAGIKKEAQEEPPWLRREGSNLRPSGYEPDELPLLYFAMWRANLRTPRVGSKVILP